MSQIRLVTLSAYVYIRARTHMRDARNSEMRIRITTGKVGEPAREAPQSAHDPSQFHRAEIEFHIAAFWLHYP